MTTFIYGWKPDLPDFRDYHFKITAPIIPPLHVDLRPDCPPVYDQGQLGSCTANAIAGAIEFDQIKENISVWIPSRLFIYYNERVMEGTVKQDAGAMIRDGVKSINTLGACPEKSWPYTISKFARKPTKTCYTTAAKHPSVQYQRVIPTVDQIEQTLASGYPIIFGFSVYSNFESAQVAQTGILNMPTKSERLLGGHAVLAVGYDHTNQRVLVRNSWGNSWGLAGYFWMPYDYITNTNLADDFWVVNTVK